MTSGSFETTALIGRGFMWSDDSRRIAVVPLMLCSLNPPHKWWWGDEELKKK